MIYISDLGHLKINHDINFFFKLFKVVFNHMPHLFVDNDFLAWFMNTFVIVST
jgi:hypothetical protein